MSDFAKARQNMVDCQIHPNGVIDPRILLTFETLPREIFVPSELRGIAYNDEDLILADNRMMLEPQTHARMLQLVSPLAQDVCMVVGDGSGYASAVLAQLTSTVISVASNESENSKLSALCENNAICNIVVADGALQQGAKDHAPYNIIFVNGAVASVPELLKAQLEIGGQLVCVLKESGKPMGRITVTKCVGPSQYSSYSYYDAATPYIPEFRPEPVFVF